jgi:hypothetical protein
VLDGNLPAALTRPAVDHPNAVQEPAVRRCRVSIAWERVPAWRAGDPVDFQTGFAHPLRRVDRVQPALLVICLAATIGFATVSGGRRACWPCCRGRTVLVLVGSVAVLVPIQRRLVASGPHSSLADITRWRAQWLRGHLLRTAAMAFFVPAVIAIVV